MVIDSSGKVRGKFKDLLFRLDGTVTVVAETEDGADALIPFSRVMGISDHVIVKSDAGELTGQAGKRIEPGPQEAASACRYCGQAMPAGTVWCPSCGKSQL